MKLTLPVLLLSSVPLVGQAQEGFVHWETPHVSPLALTADRTRLLAVNLPDNRLEVFDVTGPTPQALGAVPVGLDPVSVRARTNTEAWVVNHLSDTISIVDTVSGHVTDTLYTADEPTDVVFAGTPQRAFVSCSQANLVQVFDPANRSAAPVALALAGEDPRAMAVSPAGDRVYVAIYESGNRTTIVGSGGVSPPDYPPNTMEFGVTPYGGVTPVPNDGPNYDPPLNPLLPGAPNVGMIVRQSAAGSWLDDNGSDWTHVITGPQAIFSGRLPGWGLSDHDVAVIDTATLAVSYVDHLMNLNMALAVNPATGDLAVVGTDATNEVRFEPLLKGRFLRVNLALIDPAAPATPTLVDLNGHLDYSTGTVSQALRDQTLSDPRGIVFNAAGTRAWISGLGTNSVLSVDAAGARTSTTPIIDVGEGPTGLALDEPSSRLYVLNKFDASISVVNTATELEVARIAFHDPSPTAVQQGRRHLYDARATSGLGLTSCASCHVDARMDRLAWDLGDPSGDMAPFGPDQNRAANLPGESQAFVDYHPMKGPMLTQTLQDIIGKEPLHWRGDRDGIEDFNPAFEGLLGDDEQLTPQEMQEFKAFLATIHYPPNPFRRLDNSLPTDLPLPGHYTPGRFGTAGLPLPDGDAARGRALFIDEPLRCVTCHTLPLGMGTRFSWNGSEFEDTGAGENGVLHHALLAPVFDIEHDMKIPQLRNLYERTGFDITQGGDNLAGFGLRHDGGIDSLARFVARPHFDLSGVQDIADLVAFLLCISGGFEPEGDVTDVDRPPGTASNGTHAAVGQQVTFRNGASPSAGALARLSAMLADANPGRVGLVARARPAGVARSWVYLGGDLFQSDRQREQSSLADLVASAAPGNELTFTVVVQSDRLRIGVDRDSDGTYDRDELDRGFDPADSRSRPKDRFLAPPERP